MKTRTVIGRYTCGDPEIHGKLAHCYIGAFCSIATNVRIDIGNEHNKDNISTFPFNHFFPVQAGHIAGELTCRGDVVIGNDVWIGFDTIILSGSKIGNGAIIGANSVVRGEIPAYAIAAGSLAKVKSFRFGRKEIKLLEKIRWWDWPEEWLLKKETIELLMRHDVNELYEYWARNIPRE